MLFLFDVVCLSSGDAGISTKIAGSYALGSTDGVGSSASFRHLIGITLLSSLYVTDYVSNTVRMVSTAGESPVR